MKDFLIHCIGDSHVSVFSGTNKISEGYPSVHDTHPCFRTYRIGPHLAYNMGDENHSGYRHLMSVLAGIPKGSYVLLSFGEVDCRNHLIRQVDLQKKSIEELVKICVDRYFKTIQKVVEIGYKVIIWAVVPTYNCDCFVYEENEPYKHYGSYVDRNRATSLFNSYLKSLCFGFPGVAFLSIEEHLLGKDLRTIESLYMDSIHLSERAIPVIMRELEKIEMLL